MDRLTERHGKYINVQPKEEIMCSNYCTSCGKADCDHIRMALEKLAHYEDLEEAGRLMILPKDYDMEKLKEEHCPFFLGFEECDERCVDYADCDECWEAALKDGESE